MTLVGGERSPRFVAMIPLGSADAGDPVAPVAIAAALASAQGTTFEVVFAGIDATTSHVALALDHGAGRVINVSHPDLEADAHTDQLLHVCARALTHIGLERLAHVLILLPAGAVHEEIAARLAARFDGVVLGRCIDIASTGESVTAQRAAYGGRVHLTMRADRGPFFAAIRRAPRTAVVRATTGIQARASVDRIDLDEPLPAVPGVGHVEISEQRLPLEDASFVVAGGRGMHSEEGFVLLQQLADCIGAAVGGSLPAVDAGWVPVSRQIGQSGKYVTPRMYVAVGISGTPQHLAGIGPDTRIVAINNDAQADIFRVAEIGAVTDWKALLPALIQRLRASGTQDAAGVATKGDADVA